MAVTLEFDPADGILVICGVDPSVARHPLFAAYLRQSGAVPSPEGTLHIPTEAQDLTTRYQAIAKILQRIGIAIEATGHVSNALERVQDEERRFAQFSKQAYDIWHSQIDTDEFRLFIEVVGRHCPGRIFYRKQLLSAFHLAFAQNACNFSVPGAGKTSIVYAAYAFLKSLPPADEKAVDRLLIVGPLSSFKAWEDEYADIFQAKAKSRRISGTMTASVRADHLRGIIPASRNVELTLTSYQTLAYSEEDFRIFLAHPGHRTMMVLDEAHYIKSDDGFWASAALRLAPLAASRIILTGTPAPNGYEDLSNLFRFIYPSRNIVGFPAPSLRAMSDGAMPRAIPELKSNIRPFYTRIRKSDLELPAAREERVDVPMHNLQERIYRSLERRIVPLLRKDLESPNAPLRVRARLIRLRQASVNPELLLRPLDEEEVFDTGGTADFSVSELEVADMIRSFDADVDLQRLGTCKNLAMNIVEDQGKVLIWSYFIGNLERLRRMFEGTVPFVGLLTGATPVAGGEVEDERMLDTREAIIDRFHQMGEPAILIANPQAVGESISLHKACRSAIYFDRDFNAGRFIQSKDRIHRYNPSGGAPVTYYYLACPGTVDDDIHARLLAKEKRLTELVDSEDIPLFTADIDNAEDIRAILEAYERRKTV